MGSSLPTPVDIEILRYLLENGRGRAIDIARAIGLNEKTVWHALQRLLKEGLVSKDKFNIYSITELGSRVVHDVKDGTLIRRKLLTLRLSHLIGVMDERHEKILMELINELEQKANRAS